MKLAAEAGSGWAVGWLGLLTLKPLGGIALF